MLPLTVMFAFAASQQIVAAPAPETVVAALVEDLRNVELVLDADALQLHMAHSFTLIRNGMRTAGSFAYQEALRRQRERNVKVRDVTFSDRHVTVYGGSAIATYVINKVWVDSGRKRTMRGWCTDVFERRDDGVWLLVHRHRP